MPLPSELLGQRAIMHWAKSGAILAKSIKSPTRIDARSVQSRYDDSRRRSLLTHMDRTLDNRNPWPGFKTEMEYEAERNKRLALVGTAVIVMAGLLWNASVNFSLTPRHSENFELVRKKLGVGGTFPPDFETAEEKAQWKD